MLSLQECRRKIGRECCLSDAQIEILRDQLYGLADISLAIFRHKTYLLLFSPFEFMVVEESVAVTIYEV